MLRVVMEIVNNLRVRATSRRVEQLTAAVKDLEARLLDAHARAFARSHR